MAVYKIEGAKFDSMEELKESLWILYKDKLSEEEFNKYVEENATIIQD